MTAVDLLKRVRQRPFHAFRLVMPEGVTYDIRHPEQLLVTRNTATIGLPGSDPEQSLLETSVLVDLWHILRIEHLEAPAKSAPNGQ